MNTRPAPWDHLTCQDERKIAHLAAIARCDTINGGARAMVIARKCSRWDAAGVVSCVYGQSTGRHSHEHEAWECPECGNVLLGIEAAETCCAYEVSDYTDGEMEGEMEECGISDDNWACGTLDPET